MNYYSNEDKILSKVMPVKDLRTLILSFLPKKISIDKYIKKRTKKWYYNYGRPQRDETDGYDYDVLHLELNYNLFKKVEDKYKKYMGFNFNRDKAFVFTSRGAYNIKTPYKELINIIKKYGFKTNTIIFKEEIESTEVMKFGKYRNTKITDIYDDDKQYLVWIKKNCFDKLKEEQKELINKLLN